MRPADTVPIDRVTEPPASTSEAVRDARKQPGKHHFWVSTPKQVGSRWEVFAVEEVGDIVIQHREVRAWSAESADAKARSWVRSQIGIRNWYGQTVPQIEG